MRERFEDAEYPKMKCVRCDREYEMLTWEELVETNGPDGVVICETTPCYGSKVYDMLVGDPMLEFIICDACFKELRPGMYVKKGRSRYSRSATTAGRR